MMRQSETERETELDWSATPFTDENAKPVSEREVRDVMAIRVDRANIRYATVSGWFEVCDTPNPFRLDDGHLVVEVKCFWYGKRPASGDEWMNLKIKNKYQFVRNFDGKVIANISGTKKGGKSKKA
jgi:hypothetical protein